MAKAETGSKTHTHTLVLSELSQEQLTLICGRKNLTDSEAMRRALNIYAWIIEQEKLGMRFRMVMPDGKEERPIVVN